MIEAMRMMFMVLAGIIVAIYGVVIFLEWLENRK